MAWVKAPDASGVKIPKLVQERTRQRIERHAERNFQGQFIRLEIRFRGSFCYVDACVEPNVAPGWPPKHGHETRDEMIARLRNTPVHLCRLRYFGDEEAWGFAFFTYSHEQYELSCFPTGSFYGTPEDAFDASAVYLNG